MVENKPTTFEHVVVPIINNCIARILLILDLQRSTTKTIIIILIIHNDN